MAFLIVQEELQEPEGTCNSPSPLSSNPTVSHPATNMNELIIKENTEAGFLKPHTTLRELKSHHTGL